MTSSIVHHGERLKLPTIALPNFAGLLAAVAMIIAGFALAVSAPAYAQDVETFDPDDAFGAPSSQNAPQTNPRSAPQSDPSFGAPDIAPALPDVSAPAGADQAVDQASGVVRQPGFRTAPTLDPVTGRSAPADSPSIAGPSGSSGGDFSSEFPAYDGQAAAPNYTPPAQGLPNQELPAQAAAEPNPGTYGEDDLIGAAEGVFGKGAQGVAKMIEGLLRDQGEPNGYIVGREAGGAFVLGARYGSGTLHHKVEGEQKVYWRGPSVGIDAGANAGNTFVLVYNLFDSEELFRRYPAGEGQAYLIGGLHASYMRRDDVVLIPIRVGAGLRLGVNAGYMKFSKKQRWLPF